MTRYCRIVALFTTLASIPLASSAQSIQWLGAGVTSFELTNDQLVSTARNICTATDVTATFVDTSGNSLSPFPGVSASINGAYVGANLTATPVTASVLTLDFGAGNQVENLSFSLFDVDQNDNSGSSWTDRVQVAATLAGASTGASFACLAGSCAWRDLGGGVIEGDFNNPTFAAGFGQATVTIAGPVDRVELRYIGTGPGTNNQYIGYGPFSFACSATPAIRVGIATVEAADGGQTLMIEASRTEGILAWQVERWQPATETWITIGTLPHFDGASLAPRPLRVPAGLEARGTAEYRVIEYDGRGATRAHGPFEVTATRAEESPGRAPAARAAVPRRTATQAPPPAPGTRVAWAETAEEGIAAISLSDLPPLLRKRIDASRPDHGGPSLEIRSGGSAVPHRTQGDSLLWLASRHEDLWTLRNSYRLAAGTAQRMTNEPWRPAGSSTAAGAEARQTLLFEENLLPAIVATTDPARDYWYWSGFLADQGSATRQEIVLDSQAVGETSDAILTVELAGGTAHAGAQRHRARVELNGVLLGTVRFRGRDQAIENFALPDGLLAARNVLAIEAELAEGQSQSIFFLDRLHLSYTGARAAQGDRATFEAVRSATEVTGFSNPDIVALADRPEGPRWLEAKAIQVAEDGAGTYRASFPTEPGTRYHVASTAGLLRPSLRAAGTPAAGLADGADLVLVTPSHLLNEAERYAELRRDAGVSTLVVDLQYIYDRHSYGRIDPWAISSFLRKLSVRAGRAPSSVLLIGNGTFDHRNFGGAGDSLLPTPMHATAFGLFSADNLLGDLDGDGRRETLVARLPVTTASQLSSYTAKVAASAPLAGRPAFFADNADAAGDFPAQARALAELLTGPTEVHALGDLSLADLRERLFEEWGLGPQLLSFIGHGGASRLAEEGILTKADVPALHKPARFVMGLTCVVNRHEIPAYDALGEALVLAPDGGALVTLAPTGLSYSDPSLVLGALITDRLRSSTSIAEAVLHGLNELAAADPSGLDALYTVLGDPTLAMAVD